MAQQSPLGDLDEFVQAPLSAPPSVLADIATLQETVKRHDLRFTGLEQGLAKVFDNVMGKMAELSRDLHSPAPPPSRGGPPRRSYRPSALVAIGTMSLATLVGAKATTLATAKGLHSPSFPYKNREKFKEPCNTPPSATSPWLSCGSSTLLTIPHRALTKPSITSTVGVSAVQKLKTCKLQF